MHFDVVLNWFRFLFNRSPAVRANRAVELSKRTKKGARREVLQSRRAVQRFSKRKIRGRERKVERGQGFLGY